MMSDFMLMEPTNQSFGELLSNGVKYFVPRFQRDYAWGVEQWEDLWADIETLEEEHYHYMGYIVLQRKEQYNFEIIDGQQRLITLSLIILSSMKKLQDLIDRDIEANENLERLKEITGRFIGSKDIVSLKVSNKLFLNRNNNRFYKRICDTLIPPNDRGVISTNKLLRKAFDFFYHKNMGAKGNEIAIFIERIASKMMFTKIIVQDNLNAYKVFETLNARGVQLSTPDLLKNYIFSVITSQADVDDNKLDELDSDWACIVEQLGNTSFTDFTRYHHNFHKKSVTKKDLFKSIRKMADTPKNAYKYLESLSNYAPIYASLLNPDDEWWSEQKDIYLEARHYLDGFRLFNIKQPFTILMAAFTNFTGIEFIKTLKYIFFLSIRYNIICRFSPNEQDRFYNQIAIKVFNKEFKRASHIKNSEEFQRLYPNDIIFKNAFEFYKMPSRRSSKKIRFLLSEIENYLGYKTDYHKTTLEHICPYNPEDGWHEYFGEGASDVYDRLGNMILLEKDELKRKNFYLKKEFYVSTPFPLAKKICKYEEWNLHNVNDFQSWLSKQAINTWIVS
ncbi:MAG: DUF262 domain-containing HNH endonuclease family protein [Candidatus Cloacimonetes bacterium]|nr:DUF262 domain-containing HNH endonuclease family protein [Candidatus Cloacimonadota bacterium]